MRIMQIAHLHPDYAVLLDMRCKNSASYDHYVQHYLDDGYWAGHTLTPALQRMGHETMLVIASDFAQRLWCEENNRPWIDSYHTCLMQVEAFRPDALHVGSILHFPDAFLEHLPYRPAVIAGWHATHAQEHMHMTHYDLVLSSHGECLKFARSMGAKNTAHSYPGFCAELKDAFATTKQSDICFSGGYWSVSHPRRNRFLTELAQQVETLGISCVFNLEFYLDGPPCPSVVQRYNRGPVWGRAMLETFAASRITLNAFCSITNMPQNHSPNMRQLEGMGVGSLMLSERSPNMEAFFTPGKDLATFGDVPELVEKALYLHRPEEREAIVRHGQHTCLTHFSMEVRAKAFMDKVQRILTKSSAPPMPAVIRTLRALSVMSKDAPRALQGTDMAPIVQWALDSAPELMDVDQETAHTLLDALDVLPLEGWKNSAFCRALGHLRQENAQEAKRCLRRELDAFPENDAARHCLSECYLREREGASA